MGDFFGLLEEEGDDVALVALLLAGLLWLLSERLDKLPPCGLLILEAIDNIINGGRHSDNKDQ